MRVEFSATDRQPALSGGAAWSRSGLTRFGLFVSRMSKESSGRRELAKFMSDHVFGNKHRNELSTVVHADRMTDHLRRHRGSTGPGPDDLLLTRFVHGRNLFGQMFIDEGPLFYRTRHVYFAFLPLTMYLSVD